MLIKIIHKIDKIVKWLFPVRCFGCAKPEELLCQQCLSELPNHGVSRLEHVSTVFSASSYQNPALRKAIKALKYRSGRKIAGILAEFLARELQTKMALFLKEQPVVVPIPMAKNRLKERGFNHAELIARQAAERLALAIEPTMLVKTKNTMPQAECAHRRERLETIVGSFGIKPGADVRGKNILLIDDVSTTGATLDEAARVLRAAGANKIFAAVVARG